MKFYSVLFITLFLTSSYAAEVYQSIDKEGNVVFSDQPLANMQQQQKIILPEVKESKKPRVNQQLKKLTKEDETIRQRLDEKKRKLEIIQLKIEQAYAKLQVAEKASYAAQQEWQQAVKTLSRDDTDYHRKRALQLERNYERLKAQYTRAEQELAKVQSAKNGLR